MSRHIPLVILAIVAAATVTAVRYEQKHAYDAAHLFVPEAAIPIEEETARAPSVGALELMVKDPPRPDAAPIDLGEPGDKPVLSASDEPTKATP